MPWAEAFRFVLAGGLNVVLTFAVYWGLVRLGMPYPLANGAAWVLGIVCAYFLNRGYVFRSGHRPAGGRPRQFLLFGTIYALNFVISTAALIGLVESGLVDPVGAQVLVMPLVVMLNYVASKRIVFRPGRP